LFQIFTEYQFQDFADFQISTRFVVVADWRLHATGPFDLLLLGGRHSFEARCEWHAPPSKEYLLEVRDCRASFDYLDLGDRPFSIPER